MPDLSGHTQALRLILYSLKREYGNTLSLYRQISTTVDRATGVKTVSKEVVEIQRAVILPATLTREVIQSISQISHNKEFVVGGQFVQGRRTFVLDALDLPEGFVLKDDDWIVYRNRRYDIKAIEEFDVEAGWLVIGQERPDLRPEQVYPLAVDDLLTLSQANTVEKV